MINQSVQVYLLILRSNVFVGGGGQVFIVQLCRVSRLTKG